MVVARSGANRWLLLVAPVLIATVLIASGTNVGAGTESSTRAESPAVAPPVVKVDPVALKMRNDAARQHYLLGKQFHGRELYRQALDSYTRAYALERLPDLLFEIAACHGRMGNMPRAFAYHRQYVDSFRDPVQRLVAVARFGTIMSQVREAAKTKTDKMSKEPVRPAR